ncbi:MAG: ribosome recycling factor [Nitrospiraceae bacterium]|nr:ribosome recycling factor [Nitrospiraceae bacterium]
MANELVKKSDDKMNKAHEVLKKEFAAIRTGRASLGILDGIQVDYYGTPTPLNQVANMAVPDARTITIQPWEAKMLGAIEKALLASDVGITPTNDGKIIRLTMPPLTEERRQQIVKHAKKLAEDTKVACRNIRHDANNDIKKKNKDKDAHISEDEVKKIQDEIQKLTDLHIKKIDELLAHKEKEILTV